MTDPLRIGGRTQEEWEKEARNFYPSVGDQYRALIDAAFSGERRTRALAALVAEVEREYGPQPDVPAMVDAKRALATLPSTEKP